MRRYETIVISDPDISEENRETLFTRVKDTISQQGGFLIAFDKWDVKRLAYEIKKKTRGYYVCLEYCGNGSVVNEMERLFRIDDRVMKYMTILLDLEADVDAIKAEMEAEEKASEAAKSDTAKPEPVKTEAAKPEAVEPEATPSKESDTESTEEEV